MKFFLHFVLIGCSQHAIAQTLSNTAWRVNNTSNTYLVYFHFGTNTLSYSGDNASYSDLSTFTVNANHLSIKDLPSGPCSADTGSYTFLVQNTGVTFTLISDACPSRPDVFTTFNWSRLPTGINEINLAASLNVYPNPVTNFFSIDINSPCKFSVSLFDVNGSQVFNGTLSNKEMIDVAHLNDGVYTLTIKTTDGTANKKLFIVH